MTPRVDGARHGKHTRMFGHDGRLWVWHTTKPHPWAVRDRRRATNKRAKRARRINRGL